MTSPPRLPVIAQKDAGMAWATRDARYDDDKNTARETVVQNERNSQTSSILPCFCSSESIMEVLPVADAIAASTSAPADAESSRLCDLYF